mgnify:CR=1 FL=1
MGMIVKILLQNDGGGQRIDDIKALGRNHGRGITFIDQHHGQLAAPVQLVGEAAAAQGHLVLGAVRMERFADHQARRAPLCDQLADLLETGRIVDCLNHRQRLRLAGQGIADSDADAIDAKIESEEGHQSRLNHYA